MKDAVTENGELVGAIERSLLDGEHGLKTLPRLIKAAIKENAWKEYYSNTLRRTVKHDTFESFILETPPDGLGSTVEQIGDMIRHDAEALTLYSELVTAKPHIHKDDTYNVSIKKADAGNAKPYALRKLHKDRPDLHQQVLSGDISSHQAMVQAGFRKKTATVVLEPDKVVAFIQKHFDQEDIVYIKDRL